MDKADFTRAFRRKLRVLKPSSPEKEFILVSKATDFEYITLAKRNKRYNEPVLSVL